MGDGGQGLLFAFVGPFHIFPASLMQESDTSQDFARCGVNITQIGAKATHFMTMSPAIFDARVCLLARFRVARCPQDPNRSQGGPFHDNFLSTERLFEAELLLENVG